MLLNPFRRRENPYLLIVGMSGVKMGDRMLQVGCAHGGRLGAIAGKVGLSGRAVAIVPDEAAASRARKGASQAGALVEVEVAPATRLPVGDASFDVSICDDSARLFASMSAADCERAVGEVFRVLRPGGRVLMIGSSPRRGIGALLTGSGSAPPFDPTPLFEGRGFKSPRVLADRDGFIFFEGLKPRV